VAQRWLFPAPGVVREVRGVAEAAAGEGIALLEVRVGLGEQVTAVTSHPRRAGVVIACGDTRDQAVRRAETAVARVRILTTPTAASTSTTLH
jgi:hypothetical protein